MNSRLDIPILIRPVDVAAMFGYPIGKVMRLGRERKIPGAVVIDSTHIRFDQETVKRFIASGGNRARKETAIDNAKVGLAKASLGKANRPKVPKHLRFDRRNPGPLAQYKPARAGRIATITSTLHGFQVPCSERDVPYRGDAFPVEIAGTQKVLIPSAWEDFYPKLASVDWNSDLAHPHTHHQDLSADTYELRVDGAVAVKPKAFPAI